MDGVTDIAHRIRTTMLLEEKEGKNGGNAREIQHRLTRMEWTLWRLAKETCQEESRLLHGQAFSLLLMCACCTVLNMREFSTGLEMVYDKQRLLFTLIHLRWNSPSCCSNVRSDLCFGLGCGSKSGRVKRSYSALWNVSKICTILQSHH